VIEPAEIGICRIRPTKIDPRQPAQFYAMSRAAQKSRRSPAHSGRFIACRRVPSNPRPKPRLPTRQTHRDY